MAEIKLRIDDLNYSFRQQKILDKVSLNLSNPQAVTLLGPNGAGKSTLLKVLSASLFCQSGSVSLNGIDSETQRLQYLSQVGYMPETPLVLAELSVLEQLLLIANNKQVVNPKESIERVVEICQLKSVVNKRTNQLSLGYRQRLNLAQAIITQPPLLIMDEPLNGLDPHLIIEFRNIIKQLKKDSLVIMSTHYLAEAELISDRVLIMQNGQLLDNIEMQISVNISLEEVYMQHTESIESAEDAA